jgi:hypothetical protein
VPATDPRTPREAVRRTSLPGTGLLVCPACHGDTVALVGRAREDAGRWRLWLRCGDCGARREVVVPADLAGRVEEDAERGRALIADALAAQRERARTAADA